jgi:hypothetical protein
MSDAKEKEPAKATILEMRSVTSSVVALQLTDKESGNAVVAVMTKADLVELRDQITKVIDILSKAEPS